MLELELVVRPSSDAENAGSVFVRADELLELEGRMTLKELQGCCEVCSKFINFKKGSDNGK